MRACGVRLIVIKRFKIIEKLYSSKTCLQMAGGGIYSAHPTLSPPLTAPITMSLTTAPTRRFGFSMMWGKFCHSCHNSTYCTCTVWTLHFKNKSSVSKGWGVDPPGCTTEFYNNWFPVVLGTAQFTNCKLCNNHQKTVQNKLYS